MALPLLREFVSSDTTRIWELLNEVRASINRAINTLNGQSRGLVNQLTDPAGRIAIAHGLNGIPAAVTVCSAPTSSAVVDTISKVFVESMNAHQIVFRIWRVDQNTWLAGNPATFYWIAHL